MHALILIFKKVKNTHEKYLIEVFHVLYYTNSIINI